MKMNEVKTAIGNLEDWPEIIIESEDSSYPYIDSSTDPKNVAATWWMGRVVEISENYLKMVFTTDKIEQNSDGESFRTICLIPLENVIKISPGDEEMSEKRIMCKYKYKISNQPVPYQTSETRII